MYLQSINIMKYVTYVQHEIGMYLDTGLAGREDDNQSIILRHMV